MTPLYQSMDFTIYGDRVPSGEIIIHCEVDKWSHNIYKEMLHAVVAIQREAEAPLYAMWMDEKQGRFMEMFCFQPTDKALYASNGYLYDLYKMEIN